MKIERGQIWYANLDPIKGSEQGGYRPVLVVQNNIGNKFSPTTIIAIITSRTTKANLPTQYWLNAACGLPSKSMVECEQVRTIDKTRLTRLVGTLRKSDMTEIDKRLMISLGL